MAPKSTIRGERPVLAAPSMYPGHFHHPGGIAPLCTPSAAPEPRALQSGFASPGALLPKTPVGIQQGQHGSSVHQAEGSREKPAPYQLTLKPNWHNWSRMLIGVIQPPCAVGASGQGRPYGVDAPSSGPRGSQKCPVPAAPTAQCERGMSQHWALVFVSWKAWAASHPPSGCPVSASVAWGWQKPP